MKLSLFALLSLAAALALAEPENGAAATGANDEPSTNVAGKILKLSESVAKKVKVVKKTKENSEESSETGAAKGGSRYGGIIMGFNVENRIQRITKKMEKSVKKTMAVRQKNRKVMLARIQTVLVLSGVKGATAEATSDKILAYLNGILLKHKAKPVVGCECDDDKVLEALHKVLEAHERCQLKKYLENVKSGTATKIADAIAAQRATNRNNDESQQEEAEELDDVE